MRRFLLVLAGAAAAVTASAVPAAAATPASCASAADATYRHSFTGAAGKVTISAVRPLCSGQTQTFSLVSYTAGAFTAAGQFVYDVDHASLGARRRSVTLTVSVPACHTQVDAIMGTSVRDETTSSAAPYGTATLGSAGSRSAGPLAWYAGGTTACAATPTVAFTSACDGTQTATLANGTEANVKAVFLTGSRRISLSPGRSATIKAAAGQPLTVRDSTFTTYVGTWRPPATACPVPATAETVPVATRPAVAPVAAKPSPSPATSPINGFTPEPAAPAFSVNPAALPASEPTPVAEAAGLSTPALLAIAAGLLMIGGGVAALVYLIRNARHPA